MSLPAEMTLELLAAWAAGLAIGLERTYHGRAAGFRTHALVGLAAAAVVLIAQQPLVVHALPGARPLDPTHLVQGVMTGVGFLGAGLIFKEGVSVQGLTTAATIWLTAGIGVLFGAGFLEMGVVTTTMALGTLIVLRWVEGGVTGRIYALAIFRFEAGAAPDDAGLHRMLGDCGVTAEDLSYKKLRDGEILEYWANLRTGRRDGLQILAARLRDEPHLVEYELSRISK